jgi:uncharacterized membrane protein YebE (DUF533 family)
MKAEMKMAAKNEKRRKSMAENNGEISGISVAISVMAAWQWRKSENGNGGENNQRKSGEMKISVPTHHLTKTSKTAIMAAAKANGMKIINNNGVAA